MTEEMYLNLKDDISKSGYEDELLWAEKVGPPTSAEAFFWEYAYVVCNSGMKQQVARKIYDRICQAYEHGRKAVDVFRHKAKASAIDRIYGQRAKLFVEYRRLQKDAERVEFLGKLPWIGPITKYHLAKNFGLDFVKPDRHLVRIAKMYNTSPEMLCNNLAHLTGDRIGLVDYVIWRAANLGMV